MNMWCQFHSCYTFYKNLVYEYMEKLGLNLLLFVTHIVNIEIKTLSSHGSKTNCKCPLHWKILVDYLKFT